MSAVVLQIADAMVGVLNSASPLVVPFEAARFYVPVYDLQKDLDALKVSVVPKALTLKAITRHSDDFTYDVDVAVQQRLPKTATTTPDILAFCDPLMLLMEEILDLFRGKPLEAVASVQCMDAANPSIYAPDLLDEVRVFTSISTLTFKLVRPRP